MVLRTAEETAKLQKRFLELCDEASVAAQKLIIERGKGYNVNIAIPDYFPDGERDIFYEVHKKLMRIRSLRNAPSEHAADAPIEDSILDAINYLRFMYAFRKLVAEREATR